jgi:hypothetical protein
LQGLSYIKYIIHIYSPVDIETLYATLSLYFDPRSTLPVKGCGFSVSAAQMRIRLNPLCMTAKLPFREMQIKMSRKILGLIWYSKRASYQADRSRAGVLLLPFLTEWNILVQLFTNDKPKCHVKTT